MITRKFKVEILAHGTENDNLLKAIANHNGGKAEISLVGIIGYAAIRQAMYPAVDFKVRWSQTEDSTLYVKDNGIHTLTIQQIELEELAETTDDLKDINI